MVQRLVRRSFLFQSELMLLDVRMSVLAMPLDAAGCFHDDAYVTRVGAGRGRSEALMEEVGAAWLFARWHEAGVVNHACPADGKEVAMKEQSVRLAESFSNAVLYLGIGSG